MSLSLPKREDGTQDRTCAKQRDLVLKCFFTSQIQVFLPLPIHNGAEYDEENGGVFHHATSSSRDVQSHAWGNFLPLSGKLGSTRKTSKWKPQR